MEEIQPKQRHRVHFPQCTHPGVSPEVQPARGTQASVGIKKTSFSRKRVGYRGSRG